MSPDPPFERLPPDRRRAVLVLGPTGTIGRATVAALLARGHRAAAVVRPGRAEPHGLPAGVEIRAADVADPGALLRDGFRAERFDAVICCLASRTGAPSDAWAIDHRATVGAIGAARATGSGSFVLLSAICVQRPRLAFQHAKLAAEAALAGSGLRWTVVRPTAFFKSLSGQVERVRRGRPWLLFGDGRLTSCKPIGDGDLARYLVRQGEDTAAPDRILPIGGPGPAVTPLDQAHHLFRRLGREPRFRRVPVRAMDAVVAALAAAGTLSPGLREKAELARIGRYYATESMLVLDPQTGRYDPEATPSTGSETLFEHYDRLLSGEASAGLGDHAVF